MTSSFLRTYVSRVTSQDGNILLVSFENVRISSICYYLVALASRKASYFSQKYRAYPGMILKIFLRLVLAQFFFLYAVVRTILQAIKTTLAVRALALAKDGNVKRLSSRERNIKSFAV